MRKILTFLVFFLIFTPFLRAQPKQNRMNNKPDYSTLSSIDLIQSQDTLQVSAQDPSSINTKVLYRIPIKFRVYRKNNGEGGLTLGGMKDQIFFINFFHSINNTGIQFYLRPDFKFIDNNRLYILNYVTQAPLQTLLRHSKGCINVFVPGKLRYVGPSKRNKNFAGTYNQLSKGVIMSNGVSCPTLTHETGHYFNLKHPHKHWKSRLLQEPVDRDITVGVFGRKACEKRGDHLCDTPAEPNMDVYTDDYCNFTGTKLTDKYGDHYTPYTDNIMSYTQNRECRTSFTKGQIDRMIRSLSRNKYAKIWSTSSEGSENYNFDPYEPDDFKEQASEIFFNSPQNRTFHKIVTSKRKAKLEDKTDWMYFELKQEDPSEIQILLSENEYDFPEISVFVYMDNKIIFQQIITQDSLSKTLKLKRLKPGIYQIQISQNAHEKSITGYKIVLLK
jgi:hypothetical protein